MCRECCENYNYFPAITIGGPTGDYFLDTPVASNRWTEYQIVQIANGAQAAKVFVTGDNDKPPQLLYDGSNTLSNDASVRGLAFQIPASTTIVGDSNQWDRITHSQDRVFVRIDAAADKSTYVTIRFRVRILTIIPGPAESVHPDLAHQLNIQRSERIKERVSRAGIPEREWQHV